MQKIILRVLTILTIGLNFLFGDITGNVFRDFPIDGNITSDYAVQQDNEPGIEGITVKGIDENGNEVTVSTSSDGSYILTGLNGYVRVEFSGWPSYLEESPDENRLNSSIRFVNDGDTNINLALHNPDDFSSTANPEIITPVMINGATEVGSQSGSERALVLWNYQDTTDLNYTVLATKQEVGNLWGIAYNKLTKNVYAGAILKRHTGLLDSDDDGYGDIGVIYRINVKTGEKSLFYRFPNDDVGLVENDENRNLPNDTGPSADPYSFSKVGNIGLGDIEISSDSKTLYVVNIYNKKLYSINIEDANLINSILLPNECSEQNDSRPFALKYNDGSLYVGVTCVAYESKQRDDLVSHIYRFSPDNETFEKVISVDLNYTKGRVYQEYTTGKNVGTEFNPWIETWGDLYIAKSTGGDPGLYSLFTSFKPFT